MQKALVLLILAVAMAGSFSGYLWLVDAACVITEFNPVNGTTVSGIKFPVVFTFSEEVSMGNGCVVFLNDFGDMTNVCTNSTGIVIGGNNATVTIPDKYYYGSTYSVYFVDSPFLSQSGEAVSLVKGMYGFVISSTPLGSMDDG